MKTFYDRIAGSTFLTLGKQALEAYNEFLGLGHGEAERRQQPYYVGTGGSGKLMLVENQAAAQFLGKQIEE